MNQESFNWGDNVQVTIEGVPVNATVINGNADEYKIELFGNLPTNHARIVIRKGVELTLISKFSD